MSNKYVSPSNLTRYDEKIKEYIDNKTSSSGISYDDTEVRGLISDLEEGKVDKETGKGLFSGSYNDLADTPIIPSIEGLVSEETLNNTLADYAKTEDLPSEYDDTALVNRVTANEDAITTLNGSGEGSVSKIVDNALNEFATNISNDGVVNTYKELVDYAASHSSDVTEMIGDIEANTTAIEELDGRIGTVETNLGGHTVKSNVPENAKFTDTTNFIPLSGGTLDKNASITIPSVNLAGGITLKDDTGYTTTITSDCLHVMDDEGNTSTVGGSAIYSSKFVGDLQGKVNGYTVNKDVPSDAKFTDTTYSNFVKSGSGAKSGLVPAPSTTAGTTKYLREDGTWTTPPDTNTTYSVATQSAQGLMSASDKTKLDGIVTGANKTTVDSALSSTSTNPVQNKVINSALSGKASTSVATTSANGLMSSTDKSKLNGIASGANNYSHPTTSGNKHIPSGGSSGQILRWSADGTAVWGADNNTTYSAATTSANGLMTSAMVTKLNGIAEGANKYTLPTASSSTLGGVKTTSTVTSNSGYTACPIISGVPYYKPTSGADASIYRSNYIAYDGTPSGTSGGIEWGQNINVTSSASPTYVIGNGCASTSGASFTTGYHTKSNNAFCMVIGKYNKLTTSNDAHRYVSWMVNRIEAIDAFVIGNGTSDTARGNAFRVTAQGATYGLSAFNSSGADYAEFVSEWADGNPNWEDRVGYFVTLKDNKLYKANDGDYILGITSGNPSVVGNGDETYFWKYERDEFNRFIYEDIPVIDENGKEIVDDDGNVIASKSMKLSDRYDPTQEYIARKDRSEWDYVGMTGVIPVRDDGTCVVDGYCKCGKDGIATKAEEVGFFTYYVKERISDNVISVVI